MPTKRSKSSRSTISTRGGRRSRQRHSPFIRLHPFLLAIVIILVVALAVTAAYYITHSPSYQLKRLNIDAADLASVLPSNVSYSALEVNNASSLSGEPLQSGYLYASVSQFNATDYNQNSSYPKTISSVVFVTTNSSVANTTEASMVQSFSTSLYTGGTLYNGAYVTSQAYTYKGTSVVVYSAYATLPLPRETAIFTYGRLVGVMTITGGINMPINASIPITELLYRHVADLGID